jgi:hypothetical protein
MSQNVATITTLQINELQQGSIMTKQQTTDSSMISDITFMGLQTRQMHTCVICLHIILCKTIGHGSCFMLCKTK